MVDVASQIGDVDFAAAGESVVARLAQDAGRVYDLPEFSDISDYSDDGYSDAQEQWEESLRQLEQLVSFVLIPLIGKFFGRRAAFFREYDGRIRCTATALTQYGVRWWTTRRPGSCVLQAPRRSTSLDFWAPFRCDLGPHNSHQYSHQCIWSTDLYLTTSTCVSTCLYLYRTMCRLKAVYYPESHYI